MNCDSQEKRMPRMSIRTISSNQPEDARISHSRSTSLPLTGDLTFAYALSSVVAALLAVAAAGGLVLRTSVYPTEELILSFLPVDAFHLAVGLPILLGSMWLARRGQLIGLLCWPGALLYVFYSYVTNLIGVPFGVLFLPTLLLVPLSAYATIAVLASIDGNSVQQRLSGVVPARAAGAVLVVLTGLFVLMAVGDVVTAVVTHREVGPLDLTLWIADLTTISPACLIGGVLLFRRQPLGYVGGAGLLLAYAMLFIGLLPVMVFPALYNRSPIDGVGIVLMLGAGLICLALLVPFLRAAASSERQAAPSNS
jgi:hypothetical protein